MFHENLVLHRETYELLPDSDKGKDIGFYVNILDENLQVMAMTLVLFIYVLQDSKHQGTCHSILGRCGCGGFFEDLRI